MNDINNKIRDISNKDAKTFPKLMSNKRRKDCRTYDDLFKAKELDTTQIYLNEIGLTPLLTPEEEVYFARRALKGDEASRQRMIKSNLRLVVHISRRYINHGLTLLDLIEEGNLGLMHAIEKFNPELGYRFSTYATWWIRQCIERAIMSQTRTIRLPVHIVKELNVYLRTARDLAHHLDHEPTVEEIAKVVNKPVARIERMFGLNQRVASIDTPMTSNSDKVMLDTISGRKSSNPDTLLQKTNVNGNLENWLDMLPERDAEVLSRRFGLRGFEMSTLEAVGKAIGVTRERARQIQVEALLKLREIAEQNGLSREDLLT